MSNANLIKGAWAALHNNYATKEEVEEITRTNSAEHKELREIMVANHNELKDLFINYLIDRK